MKIRKRRLGTTDWSVRPVGYGTYPLTDRGAGGRDRPSWDDSVAMVRLAVESGCDFLDTANAYCYDQTEIGYGERLVREALRDHPRRDKILVGTKGICRREGGEWTIDGRPEHLRTSCEQSLRDLGVEAITLYQMHGVDSEVPFTDSVGELYRLQEEGKIVHVGLSNVNRELIETALDEGRIESVQNCFNPFFKRDLHSGLIAACLEHDLTYIPYSPMGGVGMYQQVGGDDTLGTLASKYGASPYEIALAWCLAQGPHVLPIPAARRPESLRSSLGALELDLDPGDLAVVSRLPDHPHPYA